MDENEIKKDQKNPIERAQETRKNINRTKTAARAVNTGTRAAAQGSRVAAQATAQAARATAQVGTQIAIAVAQAAAAALTALAAAAAPILVPLAGIIIGVSLILFLIVGSFIFFFSGPPPTVAGTPVETQCEDIGGTCQASACTGTDIPNADAICKDAALPICCVHLPPPGTQPTLHFYCQYDSWNTSTCHIDNFGCSPTSLAMIMSSFGNTAYNPTFVATSNWDPIIGAYIGCSRTANGEGTTTLGALNAVGWAQRQGFSTPGSVVRYGSTPNLNTIKQWTSQGYFLFAGAEMPFRCTSSSASNCYGGGHSVVIYDANPATGVIYYYDPTWCAGGTSNSPIPQSMNVSQFRSWYYAYAIKK